VSVLPNNQVELTWSWNTNAEITSGNILTAPQNNGYQLTNGFAPQFPLQAQVQFLDGNASPDSAQVYYQLQTIDECGDAANSTYGSTIHLSAIPLSQNTNQVNWTAFDIENSTLDSYELYRIQDGSEIFLANLGVGQTSYEDEFSPADLVSPTLCYRVVAQGQTTTASGDTRPISSSSNIGCAKQDIRVFVPNAIAPNGFNREFKPVIAFGQDVVEYQMIIHDRYGAEVFSTKEMDEGWRGKRDGRQLPTGVYVYQITVTEADGTLTEKQGTLLLVK